jgi:hypothetical protein
MNDAIPLSIGEAAARLGVATWQLRRLYERKLLPEPPRIGPFRVLPAGDLPAAEAALRQAGYLPASTGA